MTATLSHILLSKGVAVGPAESLRLESLMHGDPGPGHHAKRHSAFNHGDSSLGKGGGSVPWT